MQSYDAIEVTQKTGKEAFKFKNTDLDFTVSDFWSWSQSDLLNNSLRGVLAEFIVKKALNISSIFRTEWDSYDFITKDGFKIEVKSAAYLQSWKQKTLSKIIFDIAPKKGWDAKTNDY